jgi:hypothetical protein
MTRRTNPELTQRTSDEHASMSACFARLDGALAAARPEEVWRQQVDEELRGLRDAIAAHCSSAEGEGGVLPELEVSIGTTAEVTNAKRLHRTIAEHAEALSRLLSPGDGDGDPSEARERARDLGTAVAEHHRLEADLVLLAFGRDIGSGD